MFFNIHSPCSMYQHFVYFNYWIVVHCVERLHSIVDGHLGCFHVLAIMNNVTVNIYVQAFVWTYVFSPLGYISMSQTAAMWQFCFEFWETILLFFKTAARFAFPSAMYESFNLSTSCQHLFFFSILFVVALLGPLKFYMHFRNGLSISTKKSTKIDRDSFLSVGQFEKYCLDNAIGA